MTVRRIEGVLPVACRYTPGVGNTAFFEALRDRGTFLGARCADCGVTYLPARIFCERCLAGLTPDAQCGPEGTVESWTVAHEDVTDYPEQELERIRKKVTMVFQSGALFDSLTVGENVAFPLRERKDLSEDQIFQIVNGLLEMVGVKEMAEQFPSELSTGMKRSVAIARALSSQPECVLYDEPTTMVDPLMAQLLGDLMKRRADLIKRGAECRAQFDADLEQLRRDGRHADADTLERLIQEAFDSAGC